MEGKKRFVRPIVGKKLGGVCAGIAKYFGWDPTIVRIVYVVLTIALIKLGYFGPLGALIIYIILCICMPVEKND